MRDNKLTKWRKSWKCLKKPWGSRLEWDKIVWERKEGAIEREIERNDGRIERGSLNRPSVNLDRWRCRDICRGRCQEIGLRQIQVSRRCRGTNHQIQEQKLDRSTSCREAIEEVGTFLIDPPGVEKLSRLRIRKNLRSSIDGKVSRRCWASF